MSIHETRLYELLKVGESMDTNEDETTADQDNGPPDPSDRDSGDIGAPWGEPDGSENHMGTAQHHSSAVQELHDEGREKQLERSFSSKTDADKTHQATISQNFAHGASGEFTTHSAHLRPKSVEKLSHARQPTLMEQVRRLTGRH